MISSWSFYIHTWIGLLQDISSRIYLCVFYFQTITRFHGRRGNIRLKKSNKIQAYADIYLLLNSSTCFGRPSHPSSRVHKTVVAACGTDHTIWGASFFKQDQRTGLRQSVWSIRTDCRKSVLIWSCLKNLAPQIVWSVPETATTLLWTLDDGWEGCPKHVE